MRNVFKEKRDVYIVSAIVHFFSVLLKYAFDIESSDINCNFLPCFARLGFFLLVSFLFSLSSLFIDVPESNADSGSGVLLTFGRIVSAVHRERERHTVAETGEPSHFIESGSCSSHW